jgi:hypothetical protein
MIVLDDVVGQPRDPGLVLPVPIRTAVQISIKAALPDGRCIEALREVSV